MRPGHTTIMKKLRKHGRSRLHVLRAGRIAVLPEDPTESVNFVGRTDDDFKFD